MASEARHLHVFFFPLMAHGHMIPMIDIARLFASRGVKVTILTTPLNAPLISKIADRDRKTGNEIGIHVIQFPSLESGLPQGCESMDSITSLEMAGNFFNALNMFQQPFKTLLEELRPDCIVIDMFLPWSTHIAAKFGIPRLVFYGTSFFTMCVGDSLRCYTPHKNITSNTEPFVVPGLPDRIELTRSQLANEEESPELMDQIVESELTSYGVVMNSFYELEPAYAMHYKALGRKAWHIGPVSLRNRDTTDKAERGKEASIDEHTCLRWLDSKKPSSVLYVCFGSISRFSSAQLLEMAMGLEASGHPFIWVVRKGETPNKDEGERWLPEGFEKRMEGKGLIIRGWAPQVLILDHQAIGGFVTHCGWNSILEGVSAGVPMITWPGFAEQFYNEKLVTEVLKIGVPVGVKKIIPWVEEAKVSVKRAGLQNAVTHLMGGSKEAEETRRRAKELSKMANRAVEEGGSSYADLSALIEDLRMNRQRCP